VSGIVILISAGNNHDITVLKFFPTPFAPCYALSYSCSWKETIPDIFFWSFLGNICIMFYCWNMKDMLFVNNRLINEEAI